MAEPRRTFAPVVLVGLAAAALAAVAATNTWVSGAASGTVAGNVAVAATSTAGESPLAAALGLVLLAAWGVVLVTRRRFRRAVTVLAVATALAYTVTAVLAPSQLRDALTDQVRSVAPSATQPDLALTGWWWAAVVAGVLSLLATVAAARWVPHWPEMGSRYDAPADATTDRPRAPETGIDMWKALDEGRDPTA